MLNTTVYSDKWSDIIFDGRNKMYGAYVLRKNADTNTIKGLLIASAILFSMVALPAIANWLMQQTSDNAMDRSTTVTLIDKPEFEIPKQPEIEMPKSGGPKQANNMIVNPIVTDRDDDEKDKGNLDDLKSNNDVTFVSGGSDTTGGDGGLGGNNYNVIPEDTATYLSGGIEFMPEFPGGEEAMLNYIARNTNYPREFVENGIDGIVYLQFIVNKQGKVSDVSVLRGIKASKKFENEAMRVVASMPEWKPGKQNGHNVNVLYMLPIRFVLK